MIWFDNWPDESMKIYAVKELTTNDYLGFGNFKTQISNFCVTMYNDIITFNEEFLKLYGRYNYISPSQFLDMIKSYI